MTSHMLRIGFVIAIVCANAGVACGGAAAPVPAPTPTPQPGPPSSPLVFTAIATLTAKIGTRFVHSFCQPALADNNASLCLGGATNPSGGTPPYTFQLGSGTGFPPTGLSLGLNGLLTGTPTIEGDRTFQVCAVDLTRQSVCRTVSMTVRGVRWIDTTYTGCDRSANPLPGWLNCRGTVRLAVSQNVQSGFVSAFMAFPDNGAYYHGEVKVTPGSAPGEIRVPLLNNYVRACPPLPYHTTLYVYDAPQSAGGPPNAEIGAIPQTWTACN